MLFFQLMLKTLTVVISGRFELRFVSRRAANFLTNKLYTNRIVPRFESQFVSTGRRSNNGEKNIIIRGQTGQEFLLFALIFPGLRSVCILMIAE